MPLLGGDGLLHMHAVLEEIQGMHRPALMACTPSMRVFLFLVADAGDSEADAAALLLLHKVDSALPMCHFAIHCTFK